MRFTRRHASILASTFVTALVVGLSATAQSPTPSPAPVPKQAPAVRKPHDPSRRVPTHFGQVGLSANQKEQIYAINAKHQKKIQELKSELEQVRAAVLAECESVLNESQARLLAGRREAAAQARKARAAKSALAPKPVVSAPVTTATPSEKLAN